MNDISAVLLSIGEASTQRALESLKKQTFPPKEIVLVENVMPFHQALNSGASKVKTEFFVQVDADMIPDPNCFQGLEECMTENVGIAVGHLRDPLVGRTVGIKMFRAECFETSRFQDTISPDTDFGKSISRHGWKTVYRLSFAAKQETEWHTLGEHRPEYTPNYTYSKYLLLGKRCSYRKDTGGLRARFRKLQNSRHSAAMLAQIGLAHGIFLKQENDLLKPYAKNRELDFLEAFFSTNGDYRFEEGDIAHTSNLLPEKLFKTFYKLGIKFRKNKSFKSFKNCIDFIAQGPDKMAWISKVGLCHGVFCIAYDEAEFEKDFAVFNKLLSN